MVGIDKTYVSSYEEWKEVIDWAKTTSFKCPNGMVLNVIDYCYDPDMTEEEVKGWLSERVEIPVMNTPEALNYFLIKHCPIKVIQNRMREVYSDFPDKVLSGTSDYDKFIRPTGGKHIRFIKKPKITYPGRFFSYDRGWIKLGYNIEVLIPGEDEFDSPEYNEDYDYWLLPNELGKRTSGNIIRVECRSIKALLRKIRKWNLPVGTKIKIYDIRYKEENMELIIKR